MTQEKIYIVVDKKTGEPMSYADHKSFYFLRKKKLVKKEYGSEIRQAVLEIKIKGIDY